MRSSPCILVIDDERSLRETIGIILRASGMQPLLAADAAEGLSALKANPVDLVLLDIQLPDRNGFDLLEDLRRLYPDVGVIMITAEKELPAVVRSIKLGALDYLEKDFSRETLLAYVTKALNEIDSRRELERRRAETTSSVGRPTIFGSSASARSLVSEIEKTLKGRSTVLITGETGTGKEVIARYIHCRSDRRDKPFVAVNLPAISDDLAESELFGHEQGAFTGAVRRQIGKFEQANGGTVFLDEIGELDRRMQSKLLRVVQELEIERVGGARPIPLDIRIICATNRDLERSVAMTTFREDLYYRLNFLRLRLPPLRSRIEDIGPLAGHFLQRISARDGRTLLCLSSEALSLLQVQPWRGNVRELEGVLERAAVNTEDHEIRPEHLPLEMQAQVNDSATLEGATQAFERRIIQDTLQRMRGDTRLAAQQLGIGYSTLMAKVRAHGIETNRSAVAES